MKVDSSISVVIPTYNRVHELRRALRSVYAQSRSVDEVIVIDDGSADETASMVVREFSKTRLIRQSHEGVSSARNTGILEARGDWLALLDSDDRWLPEKLEIQLGALARNPAIRVCHTDEIWIRKGRRVNPMKKHAKKGGWIFQHCLPLCAISPSSVLIHRSLFDIVGLFDENLPVCEDYDLWLRVCSRFPVLYIERPLIVKYGGHPDQLSHKYWGMDRFRIRALENILGQDHLNFEDREAVRKILVSKAAIYANGARKRNKDTEAAGYEALCRKYSGIA